MASTLTSILVHATFSTKNREPLIPVDLLPQLFAYAGGVCRDMQSPLMHAGGVGDHVHLLISLGKTMSIADVMMHTKRATSMWIKNQRPGLHGFGWQDGYFAFSVGHDDVDAVRAYFDRQAEHHASRDFQGEVLAMLVKYGVSFDPRYIWT
ncbi:MAG: IS200/IS605 family transposase [Phycisphaerales bacterium]|nr:IS200/IS605 family transposase [Phycisphaerales bacterium]